MRSSYAATRRVSRSPWDGIQDRVATYSGGRHVSAAILRSGGPGVGAHGRALPVCFSLRTPRPVVKPATRLGEHDRPQNQGGRRNVRRHRGVCAVGRRRWRCEHADHGDGSRVHCASGGPLAGAYHRRRGRLTGASRRRRRLRPGPELWAHQPTTSAATAPPSESCTRSATFRSRPSESLATHVVLHSI